MSGTRRKGLTAVLFGGAALVLVTGYRLGQRWLHREGVNSAPSELAWFSKVPHVPQPLVFLGDSLTSSGRWSELLADVPNVLNRGVAGDTTADLMARLEEVTRRAPRAVVLMIGTNDLWRGSTVAQALSGTTAIVERIQAASPGTRITLLGVLPVREADAFDDALRGFNGRAREYNAGLEALATRKQCAFLNLHRPFADADGQLRAELTYDGVHLLPDGYLLWAELLRGSLVGLR